MEIQLGKIQYTNAERGVIWVISEDKIVKARLSEKLLNKPTYSEDLLFVLKGGETVLLEFCKSSSCLVIVDILIPISEIKQTFSYMLANKLIDFNPHRVILRNPKEVIVESNSGKKTTYKIEENKLVKLEEDHSELKAFIN